jgi:Na+-transporting NADH:ubiquinone oxidoreductase subunit NqrD
MDLFFDAYYLKVKEECKKMGPDVSGAPNKILNKNANICSLHTPTKKVFTHIVMYIAFKLLNSIFDFCVHYETVQKYRPTIF